MIAEIGDSLLWAGLAFCIIQAALFKVGGKFAKAAAITVFVCLTGSFIALIWSFVISDFSLALVYKNSHSLKPLVYKISGTWGNHEGSLLMLLWVGSLFNFLYAKSSFKKVALSVIGGIMALLSAFAIFTSNPFERLPIVPPEGLGLNPLLQDIGLALHPPMLYVGYLGFLIPFAIAVAALVNGEFTKSQIAIARKWTLISWSFLTLGIGLGSWWAYRELGWGGYWFWDPVENISLLPWLVGTAALHSLMIAEKRGGLLKWSALLSITTFSTALMGFFLVRSGLLTSVHAFASDPDRGIFMLGILVIVVGGALLVYGAKAHKLNSEIEYSNVSRETFILYNNLITCVLAATILTGIVYPLILEAIVGEVISVGAPFYNKTILPVAMLIFVLAAAATKMNWTNDNAKSFLKRIYKPVLAALFFSMILIVIFESKPFEIAGIISVLVLLFAVISEVKKRKLSGGLPLILSHGGFALLGIGILFSSAYKEDAELLMKKGEEVKVAGFEVTLQDVTEGMHDNYVFRRAEFEVKVQDKVHKIYPETRIYPIEEDKTTESAIFRDLLSDLYIVIGEKSEKEDSYAVRVYFKSLINLIWLGCFLMFCGGLARVFSSQYRQDR